MTAALYVCGAACGMIGLLVIVLIILLAMPRSRLRPVFLRVVGSGFTIVGLLCVLFLCNPLDLIPVVGEVEMGADVLAVILSFSLAAVSFIAAGKQVKADKESFLLLRSQRTEDDRH